MPKPVTFNPIALTRLIRDLYVGNVELNLDGKPNELKLESFGRECFGDSLTLHQLVQIGRGEARLVPCLGRDDTASWLAYDDSEAANVRKRLLCHLNAVWQSSDGPQSAYWHEIRSACVLHERDRVVLFDLERERLVETVPREPATNELRYQITTSGRVALVEGRC